MNNITRDDDRFEIDMSTDQTLRRIRLRKLVSGLYEIRVRARSRLAANQNLETHETTCLLDEFALDEFIREAQALKEGAPHVDITTEL
jgi:hypothetical protein